MVYQDEGISNPVYRIQSEGPFSFEMGPIRPPSEGSDHSLLIRATRNCPWNKCEFCRTYRGKRFELRSVEEIKGDIDAAKAIADELKSASWKLGLGGAIDGGLVNILVRNNAEVYGRDFVNVEVLNDRLQSLVNVANWLASGAKTVFLQDANTLIMRTHELVDVIKYLKVTFPTIERITSYARSKTAAKKTLEELKDLHAAGLSRLHLGMESGCDEVLEYIQKGVTAADHIAGGQKVVQSGISLSEYVIPGLGGRKWSEKHAVDTARVLSQIGPDFIRLRSLIVRKGTDLYSKLESGDFEPLNEDEIVNELRVFIANLDCSTYLVSDHMANLLGEIEGQLPDAKEALLKTIDEYRSMPLAHRLDLQLKRRLRSHMAVRGGIDEELEKMVQNALTSIEMGTPDMERDVESAIAVLKQTAM
ncbi:MAG: radical SAM protein [Chloroflexi bacterium]|nr:radical SAM protein [Chloroflexota bacterium]